MFGTGPNPVRDVQKLFDLMSGDGQLNVHGYETDVRPPGAPTIARRWTGISCVVQAGFDPRVRYRLLGQLGRQCGERSTSDDQGTRDGLETARS